MALLSGTFGFKRFSLVGEAPPLPDDSLIDALARYAFGHAAKASSDGTEAGFITGQHLFDVQFDLSKCSVGDFIYLAFRLDKNKVPADLLRSYVRMAEQDLLEQSGQAFLSRPQRQEARDNARDRADKEARAGAFRKIASFDVLWDLAEQRILFGNTSASVSDTFGGLFETATKVKCQTLTSGSLAVDYARKASQIRVLEDLGPAHFIEPPAELSAEGTGAKGHLHEKDFLGSEFLTWLCYHTQTVSSTIDLPGAGVKQASLVFDKVVELHCAYDMTGKDVIRCGGPAEAPETFSAMAIGKQIKKAGLLLVLGGEQYSLTLDGPSFNISGLALPEPAEDDDSKDPLAQRQTRFEHMRDVCSTMDRLFFAFLKVRLASDWKSECTHIRKWITKK